MKFQRHDNVWGVGPLNKSVRNMQLFCEALIYSSACDHTIKALETLANEPESDSNAAMILDQELYLTTLFMNPLEENV